MTDKLFPIGIAVQAVGPILAVDEARMLDLAGLDMTPVDAKTALVTADEYFRVWEAAEHLSTQPSAGYAVGIALANSQSAPAFQALTCAPNFLTGQQRLSKYKTLVGPIKSRALVRDDTLTVEYFSADPNAKMPAGAGLAHVCYSAKAIRNLTSKPVTPIDVELLDVEVRRSVKEFLGTNIYAAEGNQTSISFSLADAELPFISENTVLWRHIEQNLIAELTDQIASTPFVSLVKERVIKQLPSGVVSASRISEQLGMSQSTFQRRLKRDGTSYKQILDRVRVSMATSYLKQGSVQLAEISLMLGYADPNSFFRAFKALTGMTPNEFRDANGV